jgi:hypothetical protein
MQQPTQQLEALLLSLHAAHADLLAATAEHRVALSHADGPGIASALARQSDLIARIADLERQRARVAAALGAGPHESISSLARLIPEPARARVLSAAGSLRELLLHIQREARTLRLATAALVGHMDGLMQQVARALSHSGTYSPSGRVDTGAPVISALDLTT